MTRWTVILDPTWTRASAVALLAVMRWHSTRIVRAILTGSTSTRPARTDRARVRSDRRWHAAAVAAVLALVAAATSSCSTRPHPAARPAPTPTMTLAPGWQHIPPSWSRALADSEGGDWSACILRIGDTSTVACPDGRRWSS